MPFFVNVGYRFDIPEGVTPDGSFLLASAMPMHQLQRRRGLPKISYLQNRLFDPQLYMSGLDPNISAKHCANLASYPWFGIQGLPVFDSEELKMTEWRAQAIENVGRFWTRNAPSDPNEISGLVNQCIEFQLSIGCSALILPSTLTSDPGGNYNLELAWLDAGLENVHQRKDFNLPVYATIAISDVCLRNSDPQDNQLLDLILDTVSAREVSGVYIVLEQAQEGTDTRHCGDSRSLWSMLHLTHILSKDSGLAVAVNFLGPFGLACRVAGAEMWGTGWYKSLYRLRLADALARGRAFPFYWSAPAASDISLDGDLDLFVREGLLDGIADRTTASEGLLDALSRGVNVADIPAWRYAQSNIAAATEHFYLSCVALENSFNETQMENRPQFVADWLDNAVEVSDEMRRVGGQGIRTKTAHVRAWKSAFDSYRRVHAV